MAEGKDGASPMSFDRQAVGSGPGKEGTAAEVRSGGREKAPCEPGGVCLLCHPLAWVRSFSDGLPRRLGWYVAANFAYFLLLWIVPVGGLVGLGAVGDFVYKALFVWGALLLAECVIDRVIPRNTYLFGYYVLLAAIMLVGAGLNHDYGLGGNARAALLQFIYLCLFGSLVPMLGSLSNAKAYFRKFYSATFVFWTICCIISLVQFLMMYHGYAMSDSGLYHRQGFMEGRLFGIFCDPNYGAIGSAILCIVALALLRRRAVAYRLATWIGIFVNASYIAASQSRSAYACIAVAAVVLLAATLISSRKDGAARTKGRLKELVLAVVLSVAVLAVLSVASVGYALWASEAFSTTSEYNTSEETSALRTDVDEENISNNRFRIWDSYVKASMDDSFLFGKGPRTATEQIAKEYPYSYISWTNYEPHNMFVLMYSACGLLGLLSLLALIFKVLIDAVGYLHRCGMPDMFFILFMVIFAMMLAKGMFFTTGWFLCNPDCYLLYLSLGAIGAMLGQNPAFKAESRILQGDIKGLGKEKEETGSKL